MGFNAKQHYEMGVELGLSEQYDQAITELKKAVDYHYDSDEVIISLGVAYSKRGLGNNALECYEKVLERNPKQAEAHYFRGNILFMRKLIPQSVQAYNEAIKLDPELINAHEKPLPQNRLTDYKSTPSEFVWLREPAMKIIECNQILEKDLGNTEAFMMRAASYAKLRNFEQAVDDYTRVLNLVPNDAQVLGYRGLALSFLGKDEDALKDYDRAIELKPDHIEAYFNRGSLFIRLERYKDAVDSFTVVINLAPDDFRGYFSRGKALFGLEDFDGAIKDFNKVLEFAPEIEEAYLWLGDSYVRGG
jgi:tetratricopeptide (TPR) repeat protein